MQYNTSIIIVKSILDVNNHNGDIPAASWFAVGLLDGVWTGGKVTVAVKVDMSLNKVHLVHILAEQISKNNGYKTIDTCFAYCPELDLFIPFATSVTAANLVTELYNNHKASIAHAAIHLIKDSDI